MVCLQNVAEQEPGFGNQPGISDLDLCVANATLSVQPINL